MATKSANEVVMLPEGRGSFVYVLKPTENLNGQEEYSMDYLLPKKDFKKLNGMRKAYEKVCRKAFKAKGCAARPFSYKDPGDAAKAIWKDGDARYRDADPAKKETYAAYKGHVYTKITRRLEKGKPIVLDENGDDVMDGTEIQSGYYYRVRIGVSAYTHPKWGRQVSIKLQGLQKTADGDLLSNDAEDKEAVRAAFADSYERDDHYGDDQEEEEYEYEDPSEEEDEEYPRFGSGYDDDDDESYI